MRISDWSSDVCSSDLLARKALRKILEGKAESVTITPDNLGEFAGVRKYRYGLSEEENQIGAVTGLAWTEVGGELLTIESVTVPGKGQAKTTGKLGRSEEHTSELPSLMRISYAVFCVNKNNHTHDQDQPYQNHHPKH